MATTPQKDEELASSHFSPSFIVNVGAILRTPSPVGRQERPFQGKHFGFTNRLLADAEIVDAPNRCLSAPRSDRELKLLPSPSDKRQISLAPAAREP